MHPDILYKKSINLFMLKNHLGDVLILMLLGNHDPFVNVVMILFTEKVQCDDHLHHDIF